MVSHVFDGLKVEPSRGPNVTEFSRFSENFKHLQHSQLSPDMLSTLSTADCRPSALSFIEEQKIMVEELLSQQLPHSRDDYREFLELCGSFFWIDSKPSISLKRPGAMHKAR